MKETLQRLRPKTLIAWLTITTIAVVLTALIVPTARWASSGTITMPVDILVFDAMTGEPIEGAYVTIVWAPAPTEEFDLQEYTDRIEGRFATIGDLGVKTNHSGLATIEHEFRTGASHVRPTPHAALRWYWLLVHVKGYGRVAVPLRYDSMPTKTLREQGRLPAFVGLARDESE